MPVDHAADVRDTWTSDAVTISYYSNFWLDSIGQLVGVRGSNRVVAFTLAWTTRDDRLDCCKTVCRMSLSINTVVLCHNFTMTVQVSTVLIILIRHKIAPPFVQNGEEVLDTTNHQETSYNNINTILKSLMKHETWYNSINSTGSKTVLIVVTKARMTGLIYRSALFALRPVGLKK